MLHKLDKLWELHDRYIQLSEEHFKRIKAFKENLKPHQFQEFDSIILGFAQIEDVLLHSLCIQDERAVKKQTEIMNLRAELGMVD
ncbi:hypothetical protein [Cognatishimia sp.]|uniref:hypothetical protein n=1 Tax=Cognatishimia sp. TaxID=2211648 RepID=UPI0035195E49|nr:hypothetical protein [Cognatishimia sp.]NQY58542.1 hypothetical protein [Cognatishimia sp.]